VEAHFGANQAQQVGKLLLVKKDNNQTQWLLSTRSMPFTRSDDKRIRNVAVGIRTVLVFL